MRHGHTIFELSGTELAMFIATGLKYCDLKSHSSLDMFLIADSIDMLGAFRCTRGKCVGTCQAGQ